MVGKVQDVLEGIELDAEGVRRLCTHDLRYIMQLTIGTLSDGDGEPDGRYLSRLKLSGLRHA